MFHRKNRWLLLVLFCALFSNAMYAANPKPKIVIDKGGFSFYSSYKLQILASPGISPSELIVNAMARSYTTVAASYSGPIGCGPFRMTVYFPFNETTTRITTTELYNKRRERQQAIYREINITPTSIWYSGLNQLLTRLGSQFDPNRHKQKKYSILREPKITSPTIAPVHIEPLHGCKLDFTYNIRVASRLSMHSSLSEGFLVEVAMEEKVVENHGNKKVLVAKAVFCTKRRATISDPKSIIEFIKTKNGLQVISRTNIKRSSLWYPWVKKVVEKSVKRYYRCKSKHENKENYK